MKSIRVQICTLAILAILGFVGTVASQPVSRVAKPEPVTKHGKPELPPSRALPEIGSLGSIVKMADDEDLKQQAIAKLLRIQTTPEGRGNSFDATIKREQLRFLGWHEEITKIEQREGRDHVTVRVHPIVTLKDGHPVTFTGATDEVYALQNDKLALVTIKTVGFPPCMFID